MGASPQDAIAIELPGPEESIGDQDVISTQDHAEVARAMPLDVQSLTCEVELPFGNIVESLKFIFV